MVSISRFFPLRKQHGVYFSRIVITNSQEVDFTVKSKTYPFVLLSLSFCRDLLSDVIGHFFRSSTDTTLGRKVRYELSPRTIRFKGFTTFNEVCFSCLSYTVMIRMNEFKRNKILAISVFCLQTWSNRFPLLALLLFQYIITFELF